MKRLLLFLMLTASTLYAAENVTIEADSVDTPEQSVFHAQGNVKVFQGDKTLLADEIFYDKDKSFMRAVGNVIMNDGENTVQCSELEYNTDDETGTFLGAKAFMPPYNWIRADKIERLSPYKYKMDNVSFTTCDGNVPDWSFKAAKADITAGGYMSSWHTTARIKDVPILYAPYFMYPVKTERESGFLVPNAGFNSNMGAYTQPRYYWNIDVDQDATFASMLPTDAPALQSVEHRYMPNSRSEIFSYIEFTDDERRYPVDEGGYKLAEEDGRYFIYNNTRLVLKDNMSFRAHVDAVSDYEYLDDYRNYNLLDGYENETDTFDTSLALSYYLEYADVELQYNDYMEYNVGLLYSKEHTYSAPHFSVQKNITKFPLYFRYYLSYDKVRHSRYGYNYLTNTNDSSDFSYDREHVTFNFYKPFDLYIGTFTPSLKVYQTRWHGFEGDIPAFNDKDISQFAKIEEDGDTLIRKTYMQEHTFKLNEIYKQYNSFRHSIYNTLTYKQAPNLDSATPFDYIYEDEVEWTNEYEYTLSNYLTGNTWQVALANSQKYLLTRDDHRYDLFVTDLIVTTVPVQYRFKNEYNRYEKDSEYLYSHLRVNVNPFTFSAVYTFDKDSYTTDDNNTSAEISAQYTGKKYDFAVSRSMSGINVNPAWKNFDDKQDVISLTYKKDCWAFGVSYIRDTDSVSVDRYAKDDVEHTVMFTVSLRGLGEYKSSFNLAEEENSNE